MPLEWLGLDPTCGEEATGGDRGDDAMFVLFVELWDPHFATVAVNVRRELDMHPALPFSAKDPLGE